MSHVDQEHTAALTAENSDPFVKYVIVSELGGSTLGSVFKVKKRSRTAVASVPKEDWGQYDCFKLNQFVGGLFRYCLEGNVEMAHSEQSSLRTNSEASSTNQGDDNGVEHHTKGQRSEEGAHGDSFYALKTLHLSRVKDETLIEELKNEIAVLNTLRHPNSEFGTEYDLWLYFTCRYCLILDCLFHASYSCPYIRDIWV